MENFLKHIRNPALCTIKLSQLLGILPFRIVCVPAEKANRNTLPGREVQKRCTSETKMKYKVKFSACLMTWCILARIVIYIPTLSFLFDGRFNMMSITAMIGHNLYNVGNFSLIFRLRNQKAVINALLKILSHEQETNFKIVADMTVYILINICNVKLMIMVINPIAMIGMVGVSFNTIFAFSWIQWNASFYKYLCSCMIIKVEKIQRRLRNMDINNAHKILDEINEVSFFYYYRSSKKIIPLVTNTYNDLKNVSGNFQIIV